MVNIFAIKTAAIVPRSQVRQESPLGRSRWTRGHWRGADAGPRCVNASVHIGKQCVQAVMARGVVYLGERAKTRFAHIGRSYRTRLNSHILQQAVSLRTSADSEAFGPVVTMRKLHFCFFAITRLARTRGSSEKGRTSHFSHVRTRFGNCHE